MVKSNGSFVHRLNADGTIDSICLRCFITVASADSVQRVIESEQQHDCADDHLLKFIEKGRPEPRGTVVEWPKKGRREQSSKLIKWPDPCQTPIA